MSEVYDPSGRRVESGPMYYGPVLPKAPPAPSKPDLVVRPQHYARYQIEPIEFIMVNRLSFEIGNIVKYALRAGSKVYDGMSAEDSEVTDLTKVMRYAEMRIKQVQGDKDFAK